MTYAIGILLGLAFFVLWLGAMAGVVLAVFYWQYWLWAVIPLIFVVCGIRYMIDRTRASEEG